MNKPVASEPMWREFLRAAMRTKWLCAVVIAICVGAAVSVGELSDRVYRVRVVLAPVRADDAESGLAALAGSFGGLASLAGIGLGKNSGSQNAVARMRSAGFNHRFITKLGIAPKLLSWRWDSARGRWIGRPPTATEVLKVWNDQVLVIVEDKRTGLVTLQVEWSDRNDAMQWAKAFTALINAELRARSIDEAQSSIDYLERSIASTESIELRQLMYRLIESQMKRMTIANSKRDFAFEVVDPGVALGDADFIWPRRFLLLFAGLVAAFLAVTTLLVIDVQRARRAHGGVSIG